MLSYFDQSARSIESRCEVTHDNLFSLGQGYCEEARWQQKAKLTTQKQDRNLILTVVFLNFILLKH